jgi:hypothetical protein
MRRIIGAFLLIVASTATGSAQGLFPSVWQTQGGAVLKVLWVDAGGNFSGVFISSPGSPCPGVPYNLAGSIRGPRVFFQTSRNWTPDCNVTTNILRPPKNALPLATTVVGLTKRPDHGWSAVERIVNVL